MEAKPLKSVPKLEDLASAIRQKQIPAIVKLMFKSDKNFEPIIQSGYRVETELWDYKSSCPRSGKEDVNIWADLCRHILAFHNNNGWDVDLWSSR